MARFDINRYQIPLTVALLCAFSLIALWVRLIPSFALGSTDVLNLVGSDDPLYNLRQIELMLANYPTYAWFDPMTLYPFGTTIYWGPLTIYIAATLCLLTGATTQAEIIYTSLWTGPLMAVAMVPIIYAIGRKLVDWKTGLIAAGLIAVVSGQYFTRSYFGYLDHHITETLFATLFCLGYIYTVSSARSHTVSIANPKTLTAPILLSAVTGFLYFLGLLAMPTMILFAMIVAVFTVLQFVWDFWKDRQSDYLLVANVVVFIVASALMLVYGLKHPGLDLSRYTIGHIYAYTDLIAGTCLLFGLARYFRTQRKIYYPLALAAIGIVCTVLLFVAVPAIYHLLISSFFAFFGQQAVTLTVQEARSWSADSAWATFGAGLLLMTGGIAALGYRIWREERPEYMFVLVWSLVALFATIGHVRYEYYLAVNVVLLSAVAIGFALQAGWRDLAAFIGQSKQPDESAPAKEPAPTVRSSKKRRKEQKSANVSHT
ncbi:MAG: oligosaccharyl transferase, archaeosortase A system-associated, partial [Methanobacteriota archaeon]